MAVLITEGNPGALSVVARMEFLPMLLLDTKHLYGARIWNLYKDICGEDMERFGYHLAVELPCQVCGEMAVTGPYSVEIEKRLIKKGRTMQDFFDARRGAKPNSFWGLKNPPTDPNYAFPILDLVRDRSGAAKVKG